MPGASWKTALVGYIMIAGGILSLVAEAIQKQGIPDTLIEWVVFGSLVSGGISSILAKDHDVSNSPTPVASHTVSKVDEAKPNPSAVA